MNIELNDKSMIDISTRSVIKRISKVDIYCGSEPLRFQERHPIYRTLMKLEFEEVIREYMKMKNKK